MLLGPEQPQSSSGSSSSSNAFTPWCAFGTDVAGTNLNLYTNLTNVAQCEPLCQNTPGCTIWTYVHAQPGVDGQAPSNCFVKADPFRGQNGWTGPPKGDIWLPDSQVDCFVESANFRRLGLYLSECSGGFRVTSVSSVLEQLCVSGYTKAY